MVFVNELFSAIILAVVQGITEWFPVSSSGHLIIFEKILSYEGGLLFQVALHFGTLMAVFIYFGKDITDIIKDVLSFKFDTEHGKMGLLLIVATIPAGIVGFFAKNFFDTLLSSLGIIALGFGITGLILLIASSTANKSKINEIKRLSYRNALLIGIIQAIAIIPGISRSGTTIAAGILLGMSEKTAMKFSFILSIPVIFGANIITIGNQTLPKELIWATLVSFIVGFLFLHLTFKYILVKRKNLRWFAVYALLLALGLGVLLIVF